MNLSKQIKSFQIVRINNVSEAQYYCNAEVRNWKDIEGVRRDFSYLSNRILQAFFIQPEKDSLSSLACSMISFNKSSSKRIFFLVLLERSYLFFCFFSCIGTPLCVRLSFKGTPHYKDKYLKKQSLDSAGNTSGDLTQPLTEVMIMADRYDNALLYPKQIKLFKFYNLSTSQIVSAVAKNEEQARKNLGNSSLIFIVRKHIYSATEQSIIWGGMSHV